MKAIGVIRKIDSLGRLVLPVELRNFYQIGKEDDVEIVPTMDGILLKKPSYVIIINRQKNELHNKSKTDG